MNFISYDKQIKLNNQPTNNDVKQKIDENDQEDNKRDTIIQSLSTIRSSRFRCILVKN